MDTTWTSDLALNLISEGIGIVVTVFIIDRLIKKREEERFRPIKDTILSRITWNYTILSVLLEALASCIDAMFKNNRYEYIDYQLNRIEFIRNDIFDQIKLSENILSPKIRNDFMKIDKMLTDLISNLKLYKDYPDRGSTPIELQEVHIMEVIKVKEFIDEILKAPDIQKIIDDFEKSIKVDK